MSTVEATGTRERLEAIEQDMAERMDEMVTVTRDYFNAKREWEQEHAREFLQQDGKNKDEREAKTIRALYRSDAYRKLVHAEVEYEAIKAAMRTLEHRASIGQSLLRSQMREPWQG